MTDQQTICAITTAPGKGAIATIRLSGSDSLAITDKVFRSPKEGKFLSTQAANSLHFGSIVDHSEVVDEVVVGIFRAPHSYTGEDVTEISCHGSVYIQQRILQLLISQGARMARAGEFTQRAYLNGKMDLSQAEAVADLIASESAAAHSVALKQMKGGISDEIKHLRERLLSFITLIELELDFSEEDVEFVNRDTLLQLVMDIYQLISKLRNSFRYGNAIKNGIPVAIIGDANVGKSTLLNFLLQEERAIVSEIAGTTRDSIEDVVTIEGVQFRFIDTAGIRSTTDTIENLGIERTYAKIEQSGIVLVLLDSTNAESGKILSNTALLEKIRERESLVVINKIDVAESSRVDMLKGQSASLGLPHVAISAKKHLNTGELVDFLVGAVHSEGFDKNDVIITNIRHYEALLHAGEAVERVIEGLGQRISGDFLSQDIRECLHYMGEITGEISTDEVLGNIFKNFCIGK